MAINEMMNRRLVTAAPEDTVADVARSMREAGVGAVLVVTNGELRGVFTERDALNRVIAEGLAPATTKVGDVATRSVTAVAPDASVRECAALLDKHSIRHLPVLDDGTPVGIVSARDFFAQVATGLAEWIEQRRYEQTLSDSDDPYDHVGGSYGK